MVTYLTELFENGRQPWEGSYLVYGFQLLKHRGQNKDCLPESKKALAGWKKGVPAKQKVPYPEELVMAVSLYALEREYDIEAACAIPLQLDGYFRPTEVISLKVKQVIPPARRAGKKYSKCWGIVLAPSEGNSSTKTGEFDDSVLIADIQREYLGDILRLLVSGKQPDDRLFPNLTLANYEALFRRCMSTIFYDNLTMTPHGVRHSGASNDRFHRRRTLAEIQKRGRWVNAKSVARYEKEALILAAWQKLPEPSHDLFCQAAKEAPFTIVATLQRLAQ